MDFKIVFSDIDGTILNSEHRMLKGTLDAIFADKSRLFILKSLMVEDMYVERLAERLELTSATVSFHLKKLEDAFPDNVENMKKWYPASDPVIAAKQASTIASDIMLVGSIKIGQLCKQYGRRAFVWLMTKENETKRGHEAGSPHCAEMPYVFGRVDTGERNPFMPYHWVGADYDFMELIQDYWYHFAANGNPNSDERPDWKQYSEDMDVILLGNF